MPRRARHTPGGLVYHVLNRAVGRMRLFSKEADYLAFQHVLLQAHQRHPIRLLGYCLMPNHWHLVLWPERDKQLSQFMHWLTMTHTQRWRHHRRLVGLGPLYQGRFRAFPIQDDSHLLTVLRYVERNALRAGLTSSAQSWAFSSLAVRLAPPSPMLEILHDWPIDTPTDYLEAVNLPQTAAEEEAIRTSIHRGRPFGNHAWQTHMVRQLGLESSIHPPHRLKQTPKA